MHILELIEFQGDIVFLIESDKEPYVPIRPVCDNLEIAWEAVKEKLSREKKWKARSIAVMTGKGIEEMLCIPLVKFSAWLAGIAPEDVKPELRDKLIRYQESCDLVPWHEWLEREHICFSCRQELKQELISKVIQGVVALEESGIKPDNALKVLAGKKFGFSDQELAKALEVSTDEIKRIEAVCEKAGLQHCFGFGC